ncbi:regulatory LuxR family protein [Paractinoplanes brasiliensis]|uniref:Regulatory LuxR family protein n=2 Tax=Paractinoplanes brasiliensis TaxID=52695 RepID=A0A4V3C785_9ACTN|nr:regulatory LuxR family protein [Actinoplanes brasiliensis]GID33417.1 LuxR family transcriptional regulator [Actinoplanes brasiliensis]
MLYAVLQRLLRPLVHRAGALPPAQRSALPAVLGSVESPRPDRFLVGTATVELLSDSATIVVVDDGHLVDRASLEALAFVARRVNDQPVGLLLAGRSGAVAAGRLEESGFRRHRVEPLSEAAAVAFLHRAHPEAPANVRAQWQRQAGGNPLLLRELPLGRKVEGGLAFGLRPTVTPTLVRRFAAQTFGLPAETLTLLIILAADEGTTLPEVLEAGARLIRRPMEVSALLPALDADVISIDDGRLSFRHPLVRAATYQYASPSDRLQAHRVLSHIATHDPARQAWHAAATLVGPDGPAANSLEDAAHLALRRGTPDAAVSILERAAKLSEDPAECGRRLLDAAELALQLGDHDRVLRLAGMATGCALRPMDRHRVRWLGLVHQPGPVPATVAEEAAHWARRALEQGNQSRGFHLLRQAVEGGLWAGESDRPRRSILAAAEHLPNRERVAVEVLAAPTAGAGALLKLLGENTASAHNVGIAVSGDQPALLGCAATRVGHFSLAVPLLSEAGFVFRAQGLQGRLASTLVEQAWAQIHLGRHAAAYENAAEGIQLAEQAAQPLWASAGKLVVAAVRGARGETGAALAMTDTIEIESSTHQAGGLLARAQAVRAITLMAVARHEPALTALLRLFDPTGAAYDPLLGCWMFGDLAESAGNLGRAAEARALLPAVEEIAEQTGAARARAAICYAKALLSAGDEAEEHFQQALADDSSSEPFGRARRQLAYGEWLRRRRRVAESRLPLSAALAGFEALRLPAWTDRAQREARVAGLRSGMFAEPRSAVLSPADLKIAQLASEGMSNREIGRHLFLSHRTVAAHLYRIFPKLGITSRVQLHAALAELDSLGASATA